MRTLFLDYVCTVDEAFDAWTAYNAAKDDVALQRAAYAAKDKRRDALAKLMREVKGQGFGTLKGYILSCWC